jgi:anti-sigma regulatory factor (Ser/Thr protein kinase)
MTCELRWFLTKDLNDLAALDRQTTSFLDTCRVPPREAYVVRLALEELLTNVVKYTRQEPYSDLMDVRLTASPVGLQIVITYEGPAFDPRESPDPDIRAPLSNRKLGGLGLFLVRNLVDDLEYARVFGLNRVDVRVSISPVDQESSRRGAKHPAG